LYSLADPNWNVVAICDDSGDIQERYTYDAFGKRNVFEEDFTEKTETEFDWNRAFTGQVLDSETGLMLYRERYYDTKFGRFVNRDPIEYWADDMNIYRYVSNNPLSYIDLFGFVKNPKGSGNSPKCDWLDGKPIDELEKMLKDENISKKAKDDIRAHIKTEKRNPKHNTTDGKRKTTKPNTTKPPQSPKPPIKPGPIFRFPFPIIIIPAMDPKWAEKYGA
jgi:RHS repeat-associated protein